MDLISKNQSRNRSRLNLFYQPKKKAKGNYGKISEKFFKIDFRTSLEEKEIMCNLCQVEKPLFCYTCSINLSTLPVRTSKIGQNFHNEKIKIFENLFLGRKGIPDNHKKTSNVITTELPKMLLTLAQIISRLPVTQKKVQKPAQFNKFHYFRNYTSEISKNNLWFLFR